jgi:predicted thioesterase
LKHQVLAATEMCAVFELFGSFAEYTLCDASLRSSTGSVGTQVNVSAPSVFSGSSDISVVVSASSALLQQK